VRGAAISQFLSLKADFLQFFVSAPAPLRALEAFAQPAIEFSAWPELPVLGAALRLLAGADTEARRLSVEAVKVLAESTSERYECGLWFRSALSGDGSAGEAGIIRQWSAALPFPF
jgi:hypothetical protein